MLFMSRLLISVYGFPDSLVVVSRTFSRCCPTCSKTARLKVSRPLSIRSKFADDPGTFMMIDQTTRGETETILFNIDVEGFSEKDKTAVLKVFAKMFYNHLGFFGQNRKVVTLERQLHREDKTEEFRQAYERKSGKAWEEDRCSFDFRGRFVVPTMVDVLGMSEADAQAWFNDKEEPEITIANLVDDIKEYVSKTP